MPKNAYDKIFSSEAQNIDGTRKRGRAGEHTFQKSQRRIYGHAWFCSCQYVATGFCIVQVKPQLGKLKSSSIVVPTIKGEVKASYKWVNARLQYYEIEIPANTGGEMVIPEADDAAVTVNGQKANPAFKSVRLEPGLNRIEIRVNSF